MRSPRLIPGRQLARERASPPPYPWSFSGELRLFRALLLSLPHAVSKPRHLERSLASLLCAIQGCGWCWVELLLGTHLAIIHRNAPTLHSRAVMMGSVSFLHRYPQPTSQRARISRTPPLPMPSRRPRGASAHLRDCERLFPRGMTMRCSRQKNGNAHARTFAAWISTVITPRPATARGINTNDIITKPGIIGT